MELRDRYLILASSGLLLLGSGVLLFALQPWLAPRNAAAVTGGADAAYLEALLQTASLVKVNAVDDQAAFAVSDPQEDGWDLEGPGYGSAEITLDCQELSGQDVYLTSLAWMLYDARGTALTGGTYPIDTLLAAGETARLTLSLRLGEGEAVLLDAAASHPVDGYGEGTLALSLAGRRADNGLEITAIEGALPVVVEYGE